MTANKARTVIVYISINVGAVGAGFLEYRSGVPVRIAIGSAFISAVIINGIVWFTARRIGPSTPVAGALPHLSRQGTHKPRRNGQLWLLLAVVGLSLASASFAFSPTGIDIPALCFSLISVAVGVIFLVRHFRRRPTSDRRIGEQNNAVR